MNQSNINFFSADIEFKLDNEQIIALRLVEYILENHYDCGKINYIFCSDDYLLNLNIKYLQHDFYTDILSFQMDENPVSGEIYISIDRVQDNAQKLNIPFEEELLRVISHGILHFLGYKDKTSAEQNEMRQKEDELIRFIKNKN